eukprot:7407790-Lingulodinium_polyedra.AAC.1
MSVVWDKPNAFMADTTQTALPPELGAFGAGSRVFAGEVADADLGEQCVSLLDFLEFAPELRQFDA